jgi:hypothetical protein
MLRAMKSRRKQASTRVDTGQRTATAAPVGAGNDIAPEVYERARVAFLERGTLAAVREATGLGAPAVQRLLDSGIPTRGLPSLRDAARVHAADVERRLRLAEKASAAEQAGALAATLEQRSKAARASREHEGKVLGDAVASRADEVLLVRANRKSALALAGINASLLRAGSAIAASILNDRDRLDKLSPRDRLGLLRTIAGIVHRTAQASQVSVNMERLLMGEPTAILGRTDAGPSTADMSPEDAEKWLAIANKAFARRASRRTVVEALPVEGAGGQIDEDAADLLEDLA